MQSMTVHPSLCVEEETKVLPHTCSPLSITQALSDQNLGMMKVAAVSHRPRLTIQTDMSFDSGDDFEEVYPVSFSRDDNDQFISPTSTAHSSSSCSSLRVSEDSLDDMFCEQPSIFTFAQSNATSIPAKVESRVLSCGSFNSSAPTRGPSAANQWMKRNIDNERVNHRLCNPQDILRRKLSHAAGAL